MTATVPQVDNEHGAREEVERAWRGVWILAETHSEEIDRTAFELLTRARPLADVLSVPLTAVVCSGEPLAEVVLERLIRCGADIVLAVEGAGLAWCDTRAWVAALEPLVRERRPEILLAAATSTGRTVMPYLAARLHTGLTADCTGLDVDPETRDLLQTRPAIGGNVLAVIRTPRRRPQMATVRPHSTPPAAPDSGRTGRLERVPAAPPPAGPGLRFRALRPADDADAGIQDAEVVVTVGRGIGRPENLGLVRALASALGAALGASREVVDRGWLSYPHQVGLSGKTITPRLYIGIGVSGAVQHLAGMQTAEHIIAINRDPNAQIFQVSELGIVGDLFEIVPHLLRALGWEVPAAKGPSAEVAVRRPARGDNEAGGGPRFRQPEEAGYGRVTETIVRELCSIVGSANVIWKDADALAAYGRDEVADPRYARTPDVVVRPGTTIEVAEIMRLASRERIPVTPRGAGSGLSGGAVPVYGGIVLSMERMIRILEVDTDNLVVVVQPGVITNEINERVRDLGLFYAGYPMSLETCSVGGNIAENAGGGKAIKYGVTARYVLGLELVTASGDVIRLGGKRVKDVTGYNLIQLIVGSEGTLGIVTEATLRLLPAPRANVDLLCLFDSTKRAIAAVPTLMTGSGVVPTAVEFMDRASFEASCSYLNENLPVAKAGAMLLISVDGPDAATVARDAFRVGEVCRDMGADPIYMADNATTSERVWRIRRNVAEAFKLISPDQSLEDVVVPVAAIPELAAGLDALARKYDVRIPCYGHAGDGNLHATPVKNPAWDTERWRRELDALLAELYELTASLGGTISGEHGIGCKRNKYMPLVLDEPVLALFRAVKQAFDPANILNPGKILPEVSGERSHARPE